MIRSALTLAVLLGFSTLAAAQPPAITSEAHKAVPCQTCHEKSGVAPAPAKCFTCHQSEEAVAKRTEKLNPNPHSSHRGSVDCNECHRVHDKNILMCNDCHAFRTTDGFHIKNRNK